MCQVTDDSSLWRGYSVVLDSYSAFVFFYTCQVTGYVIVNDLGLTYKHKRIATEGDDTYEARGIS